MAGINVKQQIIQEFTDSFGNEIHEGDLLLLSTKKAEKSENILCVFKGNKRTVPGHQYRRQGFSEPVSPELCR